MGRGISDLPASAHNFDWLGQLKQKQAEASTSPEAQVDTLRYVAHCYLQASYQASTNAEFKDRMRRATEGFTQASLASKTLPGEQRADLARFRALALHCEAQLTNDDSAALDYLHQALDTLTNLPQNADKLAVISPMLPLEYIHFTNDLTNYEPELSRRLPPLRTALGLVNSAKCFLPNLNDDLKAAFLTEAVELQINAWFNLEEYVQREAAGVKALELFEQLRAAVPRATDPRQGVGALALQVYFGAFPLPEQPLIVNPGDLLERTEKSGDKYAIGSLLAANLRGHMYALGELEDPTEAKLSLSQGRLEANRAGEGLQAFTGVRRFRCSSGYVNWTLADLLVSYARLFAETLEERRRLVDEAVNVSRRIRELGPPTGAWNQESNLGFHVFEQALIQKSLSERRRLLDEAYGMGLRYEAASKQFGPYALQLNAEHFMFYGLIKRERARLSPTAREANLRESVEMFQKSADAVQIVVNSPLVTDFATKQRLLARMQFELGSTQIELYRATRDTKLLDEALRNLQRSFDAQRAQQIPIRAAEALTRIAEAYLLGSRFEEAQSAFSEAARRYLDTSKRYPALAIAFNGRASLMRARAATASARAAYLRSDYARASKRYTEASHVLRETRASPALIAIYDAWALLAEAQEHTWRAPTKVEAELRNAIQKFDEAEKALESYDPTADSQRALLTQGRRLSEALIELDAARSLEREGRLYESSDKLAEASKLFEMLADESDDEDARASMFAQAKVSRACQEMLKAEQTMDSDSYNQAAILFQEVQRASASKQLALTAGGWAASCKALEAGVLFRQSPDKARFEALKKHLASAQGYFVDAGATTTAAWVTGTERMFDALAYLGEAESQLDRKERISLQEEAEKSLQRAAQMFERAGYIARQEDTIRRLHSMIEQRQLGTGGALITAPVIQSVSGLATQTLTQELFTGGEVDSAPAIQAALNGPKEPLQVGQEYQAQLTILNTAERLAILVRVENLSQPGLEIQSGQPEYRLIDGNLELNGKQLPSLTSQELSLRITPVQAGNFSLQPRILSVSTQGDLTIHPVPALAIEVAGERALRAAESKPGATERCVTGEPQVDNVLHGGIPIGYSVVLTAAASNEMRTLVRSFIRSGLVAGKHVLYLSRDPALLSNVPRNELATLSMVSIGDVLEGPAHAVSVKLTNLTEMLLETTEFLQQSEGSDKRACVDVLSDVLLQHGPLNSRKWLSDLIRKLKANGFTTLAVLDPKLHESKESQALLNLFDGEIEINERDVEGTTRQLLRVRRMYDTPYTQSWIQLS